MSLEVVTCQPTLEDFAHELMSRGISDFVSLDDYYNEPNTSSIIVGKLVKKINLTSDKFIFIAKEVLPDLSYGDHFVVFIEGFLLEPVQNFDPGRGDRMAFFNATCETENELNMSIKYQYSIRIGEDRSDRIWCARKALLPASPLVGAQNTSPAQATSNCTNKPSTPENNKSNHNNINSPVSRKKLKPDETTSNRNFDSLFNDLAANFNKGANIENKNQNQQQPNNAELKNKPLGITNTNYSYKTLADIKANAEEGQKVNTFCVVYHISKPLCTTRAGKFTMIIDAVDQSMEKDSKLVIHFFTTDDTMLKQIVPGDVLRLHRLQIELYADNADGRIFNSTDITLFKHHAEGYISICKKPSVTESEKKKAAEMKNWFQQKYIDSLISETCCLSEIRETGTYRLFCKVVGDPYTPDADTCLRIPVCDGTVVTELSPALPIDEARPPLVTEIAVWVNQTTFSFIKDKDYILFNSVDVKKNENLSLMILEKSKSSFFVVNKDNNNALELERRIEENNQLVLEESLLLGNIADSNDLQNEQTDLSTPGVNQPTPPPSNEQTPLHQEVPEEMEVEEVVKPRLKKKALFTANNGDWSDATEDCSDTSSEAERGAGGVAEILQPAPQNTLKEVYSQLLRDQYCSPRRLAEAASTKDSAWFGAKVSSDKPVEKTVVDLGDLEDVETVINESCHRLKPAVLEENMPAEPLNPVKKVSWWLQKNEEDLVEEADDELGLESVKSMFLTAKDMSSLAETPVLKVRVFLESVTPNPVDNPYNLISGFCNDGCKNVFMFSSIDWEFRNSEILPFCPACNKQDKSHSLSLVFMIELEVFDTNGMYRQVLVCREQGEIFFNCSTREYLTNKTRREECVNALMFLTKKTKLIKPKIDLSVIIVRNVACLVRTKLKEL